MSRRTLKAWRLIAPDGSSFFGKSLRRILHQNPEKFPEPERSLPTLLRDLRFCLGGKSQRQWGWRLREEDIASPLPSSYWRRDPPRPDWVFNPLPHEYKPQRCWKKKRYPIMLRLDRALEERIRTMVESGQITAKDLALKAVSLYVTSNHETPAKPERGSLTAFKTFNFREPDYVFLCTECKKNRERMPVLLREALKFFFKNEEDQRHDRNG